MEELPKNIYEEAVFSKKVLDMLTVANEFCLYMEKADEYKRVDIFEYLQKLIPLIYLKISLLPEIDVTDENGAEHFVTEEQWEILFNTLRNKFGEEDIYHIIDSPGQGSVDPVRQSLAEGLTDIYQDMRDFVLLYQKPLKTAKENAVHDCKHLFETRTGYRLVNVLKAIHYLLYRESEEVE
jgi:hypothetical protein